MSYPVRILVFLGLLLFVPSTFAIGFLYREANDFKTLENFETVEAFEASYASYIQDCLDNTGGGTGGDSLFDLADGNFGIENSIFITKSFFQNWMAKVKNFSKDLNKNGFSRVILLSNLAHSFLIRYIKSLAQCSCSCALVIITKL